MRGREGGREGEKEGEREGERERGKEGERERGKEGGREGGRKGGTDFKALATRVSATLTISCVSIGGVEAVSYWKSSSQHGSSGCRRVETVPSWTLPPSLPSPSLQLV